jgi:hypothetical protein
MRLSVAVSALLALQPVIVAHATAGEAKTKDDRGKPDAERKFCRMETPTGSIRPVRVCKTKAEIDAEANQGQANKNQMQTDLLRSQMISGSRS